MAGLKVAEIFVRGTSVSIDALQKIPAGIVGATVSVHYSAEWAGLAKTAVFAGAVTKDVLDAGDTITIPAEVVAKSGYRLRIGFYGVAVGNIVATPTLWADLGTIQSGADPSGDASTDPNLPVWAQLQAEVEELKENGGGSGTAGPQGPQGEKGDSGVGIKSITIEEV